MMNSIKMSVVVIGYNIEKYIEQCLNSLLNKIDESYEVIFIDDGSTDNTLRLAKKYEGLIKIIEKENGGIVSARKEGVKASSGKYICFVDGDDWINPEMISEYLDAINEYNCDIICFNYYVQNSDFGFEIETHKNKKKIYKNQEYFIGVMNGDLRHYMWAKLYKRVFLLSCGYLDYPNVTMAEDLMTNAFLGLENPTVIFIPSPVYFYRFNTNSLVRDDSKSVLQQINTLMLIKDKLISNRCYNDYKELLACQIFCYYKAYYFLNKKVEVKKEILKFCKKEISDPENNQYVRSILKELHRIIRLLLIYGYKHPSLCRLNNVVYKLLKEFKSIYCTMKPIGYNLRRRMYFRNETKKIENINENEKVIFLLGTSDRSNIGDHLIAYSEYKIIGEILPEFKIIEITGDHYRYERKKLKNIICNHPIIISGGGFLGDLWLDEENMVRSIISDYAKNRILVLPQTVFFIDYMSDDSEYRESLKYYNTNAQLCILARDEASYHLLCKMIGEERTELFPDMALFTKMKIDGNTNSGKICLCLRKDKEKIISNYTRKEIISYLQHKSLTIEENSTLISGKKHNDLLLNDRYHAIVDKIIEFSKVKLVITDRLHGMIIATIAGTPCIAIDNSNHKVGGVYHAWMENLDSITFIEDEADICKEIDIALCKGHKPYNTEYLIEDYDRLKKYVTNYFTIEELDG